MTAHQRLADALRATVEAHRLPPCLASPWKTHWLSENRNERAQAAELCHGCPVLTQCARAAQETRETFGVWAGQDRTQRPGKKRKEHPNDRNQTTTGAPNPPPPPTTAPLGIGLISPRGSGPPSTDS